MGGAVGHLMHVYDDLDLSFDEIVNIIGSAARGELRGASEKLDGLNIVFSWNVAENSLVVARNRGDIKTGGMGAAELAEKFSGRGDLTTAFAEAFDVLRGAIGSLNPSEKKQTFGPNTNKWYSAEIIYTKNPNVIRYDHNAIVFHSWPVFSASARSIDVLPDSRGVDLFVSRLEKMQVAASPLGWKVRGPAIVNLGKLSNGTLVDKVTSRILALPNSVGLGPSATVRDYLTERTRIDVDSLGLPEFIAAMVVKRCLKAPGAPSLIDIKKKTEKSGYGNINAFINGFPKALKGYLRPLEFAINEFAVELLGSLESTLISDTGAEVVRLRGAVEKKVKEIEASGHSASISLLRSQMDKLKSVSNITSPVEGVVFIRGGSAYKFTGSFAAANTILGIFRYDKSQEVMV